MWGQQRDRTRGQTTYEEPRASLGKAAEGSRRAPFHRGRRKRGAGLHRSSLEESDCWNRLQVRAARPFLLDRWLRWGVCMQPPSMASRLCANEMHSLLPSIHSLQRAGSVWSLDSEPCTIRNWGCCLEPCPLGPLPESPKAILGSTAVPSGV